MTGVKRIGDVVHQEAALIPEFLQGCGPDPIARVDPDNLGPQPASGFKERPVGTLYDWSDQEIVFNCPMHAARNGAFPSEMLVGVKPMSIGGDRS
jgi:hypothetical protein